MLRTKDIILIFGIIILFNSCKDVQKGYYENGDIKSEIEVKDNMKNGVAKWYYPTGSLQVESFFVNDKEQGKVKKYYKNGSLNIIANFKDGLQDGDFVEYYSNGNLKSEQFFTKGEQDKEYKSYFFNNQLSMFAIHEKGKSIFYEKYDSLGNWIDEFRWVDVFYKDTIFKGDEYKFKVEIKGPQIAGNDSVFFYFSVNKAKDLPIIVDTTIYPIKDNVVNISFKANEIGEFLCAGVISTKSNSGKRKDHNVPNHIFYIVDREL